MAKFKKQCTSGDKASRYILLLNVTYKTGDVSTNKTPLSYTLQLAGGNYDGDNYNQYNSSFYGYTCNGSVTIKNKKTGATLKTSTGSSKGSVSNTSAITIASGSFDAPHNDDGTLTLSFSGTFTGGLSTQASGGSVSGDVVLPTIARAHGIVSTDAFIETPPTITITNKIDSFTTTIKYEFGDLSDTIVEKTNNTSISNWVIPETFYKQIPNKPYGYCKLTAITYNGTKEIGSNSYEFKVTADPDRCRPTATITAKDTNETTKNLTDGTGNVIVIGKSNVLCEITREAQKSATIKSVKINGVEIGTTATNYLLNNANTNTFEIVVTDSREYTNTKKVVTLEKIDYIDVSISAGVVRNTPTDGKVNITFSGNYFNNTFGDVANTLDVQYKYKEKGASDYSTPQSLALTLTGNTFKGEVKEIGDFDYQKEYIFQVIATDKLTSAPKTPVEIVVNKGEPMWWWDEEAFRVLTEFLVKDRNILNEIGLLSSLSTTSKSNLVGAINELKTSILNTTDVESYSLYQSGYIRWKNGFQIAWTSKQVTAGGTAWGNVYYSDHALGDWSKAFNTCYICLPHCNSATYWASASGSSATSAGSVRCFRPNNSTATIWVGAIGFGKWK